MTRKKTFRKHITEPVFLYLVIHFCNTSFITIWRIYIIGKSILDKKHLLNYNWPQNSEEFTIIAHEPMIIVGIFPYFLYIPLLNHLYPHIVQKERLYAISIKVTIQISWKIMNWWSRFKIIQFVNKKLII